MSKLFSKLKDLQLQRGALAGQGPSMSIRPIAPVISMSPIKPQAPEAPDTSVPQTNQFPIAIVVIGLAAIVAAMVFLGFMLLNAASIKNQTLVSINEKIQQQHNQILFLNKKLLAEQSSVEKRIRKIQNSTSDLSDTVQAKLSDIDSSLKDKFDNLNNNMESKLDQSTTNMNRIEAVLQSNIDEINSKLNKLQMSAPAASDAGDQTKTISSN